MRKYGNHALVLGLAAAVASSGLQAQGRGGDAPTIILSEDRGRGMTIGAQVDSRERLVAAGYSGSEIADEFKRLCLDTRLDPAAMASAAPASPWGFTQTEVSFEQQGKVPAFRQDVLASPSALAAIWLGNDAGLRKKPILIRDRGVLVTSGYGPYKASGKQCNLDVKLSGLATVDGFVARMSEHVGSRPVKLVSKTSFADGHWAMPPTAEGPVRISFSAVDLNKRAQLLHIVLQTVPARAR